MLSFHVVHYGISNDDDDYDDHDDDYDYDEYDDYDAIWFYWCPLSQYGMKGTDMSSAQH